MEAGAPRPLEEALEGLEARMVDREGYRAAVVPAGRLREAAERLRAAGYDMLLSISGVDEPKRKVIRVVYHFTSSRSPSSLVALEVEVPREEPRLPSISDVYPAAELQEREQREMLGVEFEGLRDRRHLLLPEDWPEGVYPLRKDFRVPDEPFMSTKPSRHGLEDLQRMLAELEGEGGNQ